MCLQIAGSPISLSDPHYYINIDGNLDIFSTDPTDRGQFTCAAKNPVGDAKKTITLTVQGKRNKTLREGEHRNTISYAESEELPDTILQRNATFILLHKIIANNQLSCAWPKALCLMGYRLHSQNVRT